MKGAVTSFNQYVEYINLAFDSINIRLKHPRLITKAIWLWKDTHTDEHTLGGAGTDNVEEDTVTHLLRRPTLLFTESKSDLKHLRY